jgi:3-oxoacyl-[acyl-carrier-protein] synthase II
LSAASGITEVAATLVQMRDGFVHPTAMLDDLDPNLAMVPIGVHRVERVIRFALSNACGGGGVNTTVAIASPKVTKPSAPVRVREEPVVISSLGLISSACTDPTRGDWDLSEPDTSGLGRLESFDVYRWYEKDSNYGYMNRAAQLAATAARIALSRSGRPNLLDRYPANRVCVVAGTCFGGSPEASAILCEGLRRNPNLIKPSDSLDHGIHLGAALICRHNGFTGPTCTLIGGESAGLEALIVAHDALKMDRADAAVVAGFDAVDHSLLRAASLMRNKGVSVHLAEGSGAALLERSGNARSDWLAEIQGTWLSSLPASHQKLHGTILSFSEQMASFSGWPIYWTAPSSFWFNQLLEGICATLTPRTVQKCTRPNGRHFLAAEGMIALADAIASRDSAIVVSAGISGSVAAVALAPSGTT